MITIKLRATAVSLIYAISINLFGGTAQFVITRLIKHFGAVSSAYYVAGTSLLSVITILMMPETRYIKCKRLNLSMSI